MTNERDRLDQLFQAYREACPEVEPSPNFMPALWQRIENRNNFWFVFPRLARTMATASAALFLLLLALNAASPSRAHSLATTYTDALMADHTAEQTYYTEAIRPSSDGDQRPDGQAPR